MVFGFLERIVAYIITVINSLGYIGIVACMAIESACIPLPSEIILPLAGNMASEGLITLLGANIAVAIGSIFGSIVAYFAGYYGGRPLVLKYGKYLLISKEHFFKAEKTFLRYGGTAVFFGRLLPIVRTFISLPAGMAKYDFKKFITYSLLGMIPWNFILIYLGYQFGRNYETLIRPFFKKFEYIILILLIIAVIALFIRSAARKRQKRSEKDIYK